MITKRSTLTTVDLEEYGEVSVPRELLSFMHEETLERCRDAFSPLVNISSDIPGKRLVFAAGSRVGVLAGFGLRVQVRPRVAAREFCTLIRYALHGIISREKLRIQAPLSWGIGFEDVLATLLSEEVEGVLQTGLSRRYEEQRESLDVIRGRILWEKNFPWRGAKAREITCRYHRLTYDNLDNRILLAGLRLAFFMSGRMDVKRRSGGLLNGFRSFAAEVPVSVSDFEKVSKGYNRLNEHYRVGHGLSRMLLLTLRPEAFFREGKEEVFGLALDMAEIFERFVERLLADLLGPKGFRLLPQARDSRAILDDDGRTYASVRPDIEVWRAGRPVGVIDAKYKPYWAAASDSGAPGRKISNEDLYQLFFYQQRMQRKYSLPVLPTAVIAAPLPEVDERDGKACIPERFRKIRWQAGVEREGDVRLVLVPITRFLRLLKEQGGPAKAVSAVGLEDVVSLFEGEVS